MNYANMEHTLCIVVRLGTAWSLTMCQYTDFYSVPIKENEYDFIMRNNDSSLFLIEQREGCWDVLSAFNPEVHITWACTILIRR